MAGYDLLVRLWGVRGSHPVPGQSTLRYGGNTSCVEIRTKDQTLILDAGTGIINLGQRLLREQRDRGNQPLDLTVLISHTHYDHIQGLPFFSPAYRPDCRLRFYGPKSLSEDLGVVLGRAMSPQFSPIEMDELKAQIEVQNITENDVLLFEGREGTPRLLRQHDFRNHSPKNLVVRILRSYGHPKIGVFVFRIERNGKSVVYATDTEGYVGADTRLIEFARGANLLIHDAQYTPEEYLNSGFPKQGFGHSTYEMAARVAKEAGVGQLVLFHHEPSHDDDQIAGMEARTRQLFPAAEAGTEGKEFAL